MAFCQDQMKILKEKIPNAKDRFAAANKKWHELSIKDKSRYQLKVNEKLRKYSIELQEWFKVGKYLFIIFIFFFVLISI